jgi:hypothetical protein
VDHRMRPDITSLPDLRRERPLAGPVRDRRPVYVDLLPPCNAGCPAGENIQAWLAHAEAGRHEQAWRQFVADNPMPGIHGRVCYHPCESACNRAFLDSAVSIHAVERFLGDLALDREWLFDRPPRSSGKRVPVIGAGPSGLSAALQAIAYGYVYVARVAMGADPQQTLRAFREAEAYDGPSLIIAYSHCIAHGIEMRDGLGQQYRAVASGYWPLIRYDPVLRSAGGNPFLLDSPRPRIPLAAREEDD